MVSKNTESLGRMNCATTKFAKWYVRALDPQVIDYSLKARGEKVDALTFQCVLVSNAPSSTCSGWCPFNSATAKRRPLHVQGLRLTRFGS